MEENSSSALHMALDIVIFCFAISALLFLVYTFSSLEKSGAKSMEQKTNVSTAYGDSVTETLVMSKAEVSTQICQLIKSNTVIVINGHTLSDSEKETITMDDSYVNNFLSAAEYTKKDKIDGNGKLKKVTYKTN